MRTSFGRRADGRETALITLSSGGIRVAVSDDGGRIVSFRAPDRAGRAGEILLGFDSVAGYAGPTAHFAGLLGRFANRIGAPPVIDGNPIALVRNEPHATLHGGPDGFHTQLWDIVAEAPDRVTLRLVSPAGKDGFPGTLTTEATYRVTGDTLWLEFSATTDATTLANFSVHPYFNLGDAPDVLGHLVEISAEHFLPTDAAQLPTGERRAVGGTPFEFRQPTALGARIRAADEQLRFGLGYDHCFVLADAPRTAPALAARAADPVSGRVLEVLTTHPAVQLYTGNKLQGSVQGRNGVLYRQSAGFCFEPSGFPDSPNHPDFPSALLRPGETARAAIGFRATTA